MAKYFGFFVFTILGLALLGARASGRTLADPVDDLVRAEMEKRQIPGLSLAVVRDGKVIKAQGYGFANLEHRVPADADTVYQLASVTKQFTSAAVMMLVEEGKIKLDGSISEYLPNLPEAWKAVTVRHLLNHTSGIKSYTGVDAFKETLRKDYTPEELLGLVRDIPLEFAPGTEHRYNNTGYYLLGMLIEKVSGKSYGEFLKERIFDPLGMNDTRVNDHSVIVSRRAAGYMPTPQGIRNAEYVSPTQPYAAGALLSTINDMVKWNAALGTDKLLQPESWKAVWSPTKLTDGKTVDYGFGWEVATIRGHRRIAHSGGIPGFNSYIMRLPDDNLSVIVLTNSEGANPETIAMKIAETYLPELIPPKVEPISDPDPARTRRLRAIVQGLSEGKATESDFTEGMWKFLYPDRLKEGPQMLGALGTFRDFDLISETKDGESQMLRYRALFGETALFVLVTLTDGKIAGIGFAPE
ncbi:MAG: hypothetical protein OHK0029_35830 [Armatimonadaceae bacterium]